MNEMGITEEELPEGWRWVRLGDVCQIIGGTTPSTAVPEYWDGSIVWITPADMGKLDGHEIWTSQRKISHKSIESLKLRELPIGTVILSSRAPIGYVGIAKAPLCTNQGCKSFVPSDKIESEYLYFSLKYYVPDFEKLGSGSTYKEISKSKLEKFEIPLPPLLSQKRIATKLKEQMVATEKARTASQARLEAINALPAAFLRQTFPQPDQPLPNGWRWVKLGDVCTVITGTTPKRSESKYYGGKTPWIKPGDLAKNIYVSSSDEYLTKEGISQSKLLPAGSVLVSCIGNIGKTAIADCPLCTNQQINSLVPSQRINSLFLYFLIKEIQPKIENLATTSLVPIINKFTFSEISIPMPPLTEQKPIAAILKEQMVAIKKARIAAEEELNTINAMPATLLRRAFNGEL